MESDSEHQDDNPYDQDADNIIFQWEDGFLRERGSEFYTPWVSCMTAEALRPGCNAWSPTTDRWLGFCSAVLVRFDEMEIPERDFEALPTSTEESTRQAIYNVFNPATRKPKSEFRGKGIWGTDDEDNSWLLVVERFDVKSNARRQGWGRKLVTRILNEVLDRARLARKTVLVLSLPTPPKHEIQAKTMEGKQSLRIVRAFWRSIGFVRLGETMFWGWARTPQADLLSKVIVPAQILEQDLEIDRRCGHLAWLEELWHFWHHAGPQHKQNTLAAF